MHSLFVEFPVWLGLILLVVTCWCLTILGLPGNWFIVAIAFATAWLAPADSRLTMGPLALTVLVALAVLGEIVEFAAGSVATRRAGGSRRAALMAIVGAFVGAVAGAVMGLPIPIIGSAVAAVLFGAAGALVGALLGERHSGNTLAASWRVGHAAFWGRLFGTIGKASLGAVMVIVAAAALTL